jgi:hypothetical protein
VRNVSLLEIIGAGLATNPISGSKIGIVQQILADEGFGKGQSGRLCLGFDSSCAIRSRHLGMKLHENAAVSGQRQQQGQALE